MGREDVPAKGRFSLSPLTYLNIESHTRIVLASPNGATCIRYARRVPILLVGALLNAQSVAHALSHVLQTTERAITILSCGERYVDPDADGPLRHALEDDLGAGAIISYLSCEKSPEARACEGAFIHLRDDLPAALTHCPSGQELCDKGFAADVAHAAQLNWSNAVPTMRGEHLVNGDFPKPKAK